MRVEGAAFEGHGDGVWHVHLAGMRVVQHGGECSPAGVRHQARVDSGSQRFPAAGVRGCGEPFPDLCDEAELLVGKAGWIPVPGPDERRDAGADDLSWTSLVPQRREQSGDVVGEGGLGFELLAGQPDGDVLQGA